MKKLFFSALLVVAIVFAGGCTQQQSSQVAQADWQGNGSQQPIAGSQAQRAFGLDRNFFQRACTIDADCALPQRARVQPRDLNGLRDFNAPRDFNSERWRGSSPDANRQRAMPVLKCVSGYCKIVSGGSNEAG